MSKNYFNDILYSNNDIVYIHACKCIELKRVFDKNKVDGKKVIVDTFISILQDNKDSVYDFHIDMSNITLSQIESEFSLVRKIVNVFCNCDTNLPGNCDIHNVPYSFSAIWKMVSPLISKDGQKKIRIHQKHRDEKHRDEKHRDEKHRDEKHRDEKNSIKNGDKVILYSFLQ